VLIDAAGRDWEGRSEEAVQAMREYSTSIASSLACEDQQRFGRVT
jgi:hypothetical protein